MLTRQHRQAPHSPSLLWSLAIGRHSDAILVLVRHPGAQSLSVAIERHGFWGAGLDCSKAFDETLWILGSMIDWILCEYFGTLGP